jgi:hypothetical protein
MDVAVLHGSTEVAILVDFVWANPKQTSTMTRYLKWGIVSN